MADEKGEVKLAEHVERHDGRVALLLVVLAAQGGNNAGGLAVRREEVVSHVLDEDTLALQSVSIVPFVPRGSLQSVLWLSCSLGAAASEKPIAGDIFFECNSSNWCKKRAAAENGSSSREVGLSICK